MPRGRSGCCSVRLRRASCWRSCAWRRGWRAANSAAAGSVDAQEALGTAYYLGRGLPRDLPQAAHWYRAAALGGDVGAMYLIASMYEHGDGLAADLRLASYWYLQAAQAGDVLAAAKAREMAERLRGGSPATARP